MSPAATYSAPRCSPAACGATNRPTRPGDPTGCAIYFINDGAAPSFVVDVSAHYQRKRAALDCYRSQFAATEDGVATRLTASTFRQLIESRDAQFGALAGVAFAEGIVVTRADPAGRTLLKQAP